MLAMLYVVLLSFRGVRCEVGVIIIELVVFEEFP